MVYIWGQVTPPTLLVHKWWRKISRINPQRFLPVAEDSIQVLATTIPQAFIQAANLAVPKKSSKPPNFKVNKSEEWRKAEAAAVKATKKWRVNGCPHEPENEFFISYSCCKSISVSHEEALNCITINLYIFLSILFGD